LVSDVPQSVSQLADSLDRTHVQHQQAQQVRQDAGSSSLRELRKKVARLEEEVHLKAQIVALQKELNSPTLSAGPVTMEGRRDDGEADPDSSKTYAQVRSEKTASRRDAEGRGSPLSLAAQRRIETSGGSGYGSGTVPEGSEAQAEEEFQAAAAAAAAGAASGASTDRTASRAEDVGRSTLHALLLRKLRREMAGLQSASTAPAATGAPENGGVQQMVPDMNSKLSFAAQRRDIRWAERGGAAATVVKGGTRLQALDSAEGVNGAAPAAEASGAASSCLAPDCLQLSGAGATQRAGSIENGGISLTLIKGVGADRCLSPSAFAFVCVGCCLPCARTCLCMCVRVILPLYPCFCISLHCTCSLM
jgi:hypothetical protein